MKRWIFIVGIILIVLLAGIWMYLLFGGSTTGQGIFNTFGLGGTEEGGEFIGEEPEGEVVVDVTSPVPLRQLTTRKVIAHTEVTDDTASSSHVLFVESGTGHVYSIDLTSGVEERISNITVPMATKAVLSKDGAYAAITDNTTVTLVALPKDEVTLTSESLAAEMADFSLTDDGVLLYTSRTLAGTDGKVYDPVTKITKPLFTLPFRESVILWGPTKTSVHHVYPKTAARLEGYYYKIQNGVVNRLPASGYAFGASTNGDYTLYSRRKNDVYETFSFEHATKAIAPITTAFLPEKCVYAGDSVALCAGNDLTANPQFPDIWYKGTISNSDLLWHVDLTSGEATVALDLQKESGRSIDVVDPHLNATEEHLYFINRIDQALWLFDSTM